MGGKGGLVGGVSQTLFGDGGAGAAQDAANAQAGVARSNYRQTRDIVNPATVQGLASLDRDIKNQEKNLSRQEQLISQIDPTVLEASQQALKLLRGETSAYTQNGQNQRAQQRQKLVNQLREQLGPGAETSTAGMQALTRFDAQSSNQFAQDQQNSLGLMGQTAGQFNSIRPDMFREILGMSQLGQAKTGLEFQRAGALGNAMQGLQQTAGAQFLGDQMRGQQNAAFGQQLLGGAIQAGTGALMSREGAGYKNATQRGAGTYYSN